MSKMQKVIRGVMRDPVVKNLDMFEPQNQPMFSRVYLKNKLRNALRYIGIEDYGLTKTFWVILVPFSAYLIYSQKLLFGINIPMYYQRTTRAYQWQELYHCYKTNPDVHFSKLYSVQTNDKLYGLRQLPKRPWEAFKNPEEVLKNKTAKNSELTVV